MAELKQTFFNSVDRPMFVNLEPLGARFRIQPGGELTLRYDDEVPEDQHGSALRLEFARRKTELELVVWTSECSMFFPDGREAPEDHD